MKVRFAKSLVLVLVGLLGMGLVAVAADKDPPTTSDVKTYGQPKQFDQGKDDLYALWYADGAWHLRTTAKGEKGHKAVFKGRIQIEGGKITEGNFQGLDKAKLAKNADWVVPHPDGKGFDFSFATFGATDGIDFKVSKDATAVSFKLLVNGGDYPQRVLIGMKSQHPEKIPFSLPANPAR